MLPLAEVTPLDQYLMAAIVSLVAGIVVLFWQLLGSKNETTAAYKEILPAATLLMKTVESLQKFIDTHLKKEKEGNP